MDNFMEEVVVKNNRSMENALYIGAFVMMVISGFMGIISLNLLLAAIMRQGFNSAMILEIIVTLFTLGSGVLLFLYKDQIKTEYEYTFTNGALDFAKVFNNKKRKALGTMNVRNIEACGLVSSGSFRRYLEMPGVKKSHWFLNRDAELFYLYYVKDGSKNLLVMEPSEGLRKLIIQYAGSGKYQQN